MSTIKPLKCSKKIWNKLTPAQRKKFTKLNQMFFDELWMLDGSIPMINSSIPVMAHNLALVAVWKKVVTKPE